MALIANLKQKYGATLEQVLEYLHQAKQELEELENSAELVIKLKPRIAAAEKQYREDAALLTGLRREAAALLEKELQPVLVELALSGAKFVVQIDPREEPTSRGMDRVGFMFYANPGGEGKPLAKVYLGETPGNVGFENHIGPTGSDSHLIFDEVDTGIGGRPFRTVAEKLSLLSRHHQVVCVTHSAQIAAFADRHYRLYKEIAGERTLTRAGRLQPEEAPGIARMLDGAGLTG